MWLVDLRKMFIRAYIKFLVEEVTVIPKKSYRLDVMGHVINLVVGERKKLPRFIARILRKHDLVEIEDEMNDKQLITKLVNLSSTSTISPKLDPLPNEFYPRLIEVIKNVDNATRDKIVTELRKMTAIRFPRIIHRLHTGKTEGMDLYEREFFQIFYKIFEAFKKSILDGLAELLEDKNIKEFIYADKM